MEPRLHAGAVSEAVLVVSDRHIDVEVAEDSLVRVQRSEVELLARFILRSDGLECDLTFRAAVYLLGAGHESLVFGLWLVMLQPDPRAEHVVFSF